MTIREETIAALATPPGRGGIGVVRVSGAAARHIASEILGRVPSPRRATLCGFRDRAGDPIDTGIALYFPAPNSYTGEDVLELQGHGGPVVMDLVLARILELGGRPARPGEFTERAFLNDKLDLSQAEAVADLIDSATAAAARAAAHSLQGQFSAAVNDLVEGLIQLRMHVEAAIDFPEEEIDFLADEALGQQLDALRERVFALQDGARQGQLLRDGINVVLAGRPNAGKSSLLNRLAERDTAIVSAEPGTTRDVVRDRISLGGMPLHLVDTAGLRESLNEIESEGVRRAWKEIQLADHVLVVVDDRLELATEDAELLSRLPAQIGATVVLNKIDLSGRQAGLIVGEEPTSIAVSAKFGDGIEALRAHLTSSMGFQAAGEGQFSARRRHLSAIKAASQHLDEAHARLHRDRAGELLAEELRLAQNALSEITGEFASDDLLGRIFSEFCIGK